MTRCNSTLPPRISSKNTRVPLRWVASPLVSCSICDVLCCKTTGAARLTLQIYKLTPADMCELARNSVLQSGWEMQVKRHWIGQKWYMPGAAGNDIHKTNVPNIRLSYRHATLLEEL
jgi:hypothetical protein